MIVLGLAGQAGVGKDTVANYLRDTYGFVVFAFSSCLYAEVAAAFGLEDESLLRDRATKEVPTEKLSLQYCQDANFFILMNKLLDRTVSESEWKIHWRQKPLSPRQILQWWGTQYRRAQDPNYWLNKNEDFLLGLRAMYRYPEQAPQHFVNTTCRFPNEQEWIHTGAHGGLWAGNVWHIRRDGIASVAAHESESPLPVLDGERELWNNDSIERLHRGIDLLLTTQAQFVRVEPMAPVALQEDGVTLVGTD